MPSPARLTALGRFVDPSVERAYRAARLADDQALGRLIVLCILALDAVFVPIDLFHYGATPAGWTAAGARFLVVGWSVGCWRRLGRAVDATSVGRVVGVWAPPVIAFNVLALVVLPGNHLGAAAAFAVAVVLAYLLPLELEWCGLIGLAVSVVYVGVVIAGHRPNHSFRAVTDTGVGFVMANVLGAVAGRRLQADRRQQYAAAIELSAAAAELRTLRGLLPICSFCKQIRDDGGDWHRLEAYIQAHTHARFTHSVCPDCMVSEYGITVGGGDTPVVTPR